MNKIETNTPQAEMLLAWYETHKRDLPWRKDTDPYHVLVSEIMLQQTRVEAVRGYYVRFLDALPTIEALANAEEDQCLKLWEGLGYYRRVRNLKKAAEAVVSDHNGVMPTDYETLLTLPGIGPYTASAISSISGGEKQPAVDGNLLRIYSRLVMEPGEIEASSVKKRCHAFYLTLMETCDSPGNFNQALMDLGGTICQPNGEPLCELCPWNASCKAHGMGLETAYPVRKPKKSRRREDRTILLIHYEGGILLRRRPAEGLLAGLFEFPNLEGHLTREEAVQFTEELGLHTLRVRSLPQAKHIFSHVEWHMTGYELTADAWSDFARRSPEAQDYFLAMPEEMDETWSIPSAFKAYRKYILDKTKFNA